MELYDVSLPYRFTLLSNLLAVFQLFQLVSLPYRFTLLSNIEEMAKHPDLVSLPYRFTLLSNRIIPSGNRNLVSLPYRFTLLSNLKFEKTTCYRCEIHRVYSKLTQIAINNQTIFFF